VNDGAATRGSGWGIATGTVNGKSRVLFLAGATAGRTEEGKTVVTPTRNAAQEKFGGGHSDGYVVLMELEPSAKAAPVEVKPPVAGPTRAHFERHARGLAPKGAAARPEEGTVFHFSPKYPTWVTVDAELRDQSGKLWPGFLYGKPVDGSLKYSSTALKGKFTVACTSTCQPYGEPDRRLLGELLKDPNKPLPLVFHLESLGPVKTQEIKATEKGKETVRTVEYHEGKGVLEFAGKKLAVGPRITLGYFGTRDGPIYSVRLNAYVTLKASELGLAAPAPDGLIDIRIGMSGDTRTEPPPKK
jgi:hypothetical protein